MLTHFTKYQADTVSKTLRESLKEFLPAKGDCSINKKLSENNNSTESAQFVIPKKIEKVEEDLTLQRQEENFVRGEENLKLKSQKCVMLSNPIESHYSREQDLRYTSLSDVSRSISSYAIDTMASNRLTMPDYDVQTVHSTNHRPYDPGSLVNSQTAFERYEPNYPLQRTAMYSSYGQPSLEDLANQQKYLLEQHSQQQQQQAQMKAEPDETNNVPIYPRPIYQSYDPSGRKMITNLNLFDNFVYYSSIAIQSNIQLAITNVNDFCYCSDWLI